MLVLASTYPASPDDGTPAFIRDLSIQLGTDFEVEVLVPSVPGAPPVEAAPGHRVTRFRYFPRPWEDLASGAMLENVRSKPSRFLQVPFFVLAEAAALRRTLRRFDPDLVHVHWLIPQGVVMLMAGGGRPFVLTTLGGDLYALDQRPLRWLKRNVVRRADAVTVMNRDMAERVCALGAERDAVHVIPMGAAVDAVRSAADGIESRPGRVAFAGRLVEKKGVRVLLDAVRALADGVVTELVIIGDGPLRSELEAHSIGLPVRFLGQVPKSVMAAEMAAAEVVVFPSVPAASGDQDGLPVALLEAMAIGRCVVASAIPGIDEAVNGENGALVTPGDTDELTATLASLMGNRSLARSMGEQAAVTIDDRFSAVSVGARYRNLLRQSSSEEPNG